MWWLVPVDDSARCESCPRQRLPVFLLGPSRTFLTRSMEPVTGAGQPLVLLQPVWRPGTDVATGRARSQCRRLAERAGAGREPLSCNEETVLPG